MPTKKAEFIFFQVASLAVGCASLQGLEPENFCRLVSLFFCYVRCDVPFFCLVVLCV